MATASLDRTAAAPWPLRILLVLLIVLGGVGLLASLPVIIASMMMFDAPGSNANPLTWWLSLALTALPVAALAVIATSIAALRSFSRRRLVWPLAILAGWLALVAIPLALLEITCDGQFACPRPAAAAIGDPRPLR